MFELQDICKSFGETRALDEVGLAVPAGRTLALIGPSGCGKSTLLRVMIALIEPDQGSVLFDSRRIETANALAIRRRMGYVIQDGGLFPHLTARGNLQLQPRTFGWADDRIRERIAELIDLTRFPASGLDRYPVQLSGGQRQRVSLMRALMLDPQALLLDEPLGALDPMIRSDLQRDLKAIFAKLGKTVVLVTHDLAEAAYLGHRIVLMHKGRIVQQGTYDELLGAPVSPFVTRFVGAQRSLHIGGEGALL